MGSKLVETLSIMGIVFFMGGLTGFYFAWAFQWKKRKP